MATRRGFLASLLVSAAIPSLSWADAGAPKYLAAAKELDGRYALFGLNAAGQDTFRVPLPARGHAGAGHPFRPEAVVFARRPGTYALVIDCVAGRLVREISAPDGYHFSGHGTFSADGDLLYTAEIDGLSGLGQIGVWQRSDGYARKTAFASGGTGPHEILRLPGEDILVVANGGIIVALDESRTKLNINSMQPNLTYLTEFGELIDQVVLPQILHQNSIRHLAVSQNGIVAFAMQWQRNNADVPPLLGLHQMGQPFRLADLPEALTLRSKGYAGSVAFSGDDNNVAITCPRGGLLIMYDSHGGYVAHHARQDISGVARASDSFITTDGLGGVFAVRQDSLQPLSSTNRAWDNHLFSI